ncbi:MAG: hypothetical protein NVSMB55_28080 [Mycobacteriales bacterium]
MSAVDTVEAEGRELVRRRGLDPIVDRAAEPRLVDEVITEFDESTLMSSLAPLVVRNTAASAVHYAVSGLSRGELPRRRDQVRGRAGRHTRALDARFGIPSREAREIDERQEIAGNSWRPRTRAVAVRDPSVREHSSCGDEKQETADRAP